MRLRILDRGHGFGTKALFALIRTVSRQPVVDIIKLVKYRSDFYGGPMSAVTHEAMRGPSPWSVGDRELMAAFVAKTNRCEFCTKTHAEVAQRAYGDGTRVSSLLSDFDTAAPLDTAPRSSSSPDTSASTARPHGSPGSHCTSSPCSAAATGSRP
jgi:AhpD family alkylhydroperoxidase